MKTMKVIRDEIGAWAKANFDPEGHKPEIGILEEVGEAAHVYLKSLQKIRGYDNPEKVRVDLTDALADAGVYALHFCFLRQIDPPENSQHHGHIGIEGALRMAGRAASSLIATTDEQLIRNNVPRLFDALFTLASLNGIQFYRGLRETWEKVAQRDWRKNPSDAHTQAGDGPSSQQVNQDERKPIALIVDQLMQMPTDDLLHQRGVHTDWLNEHLKNKATDDPTTEEEQFRMDEVGDIDEELTRRGEGSRIPNGIRPSEPETQAEKPPVDDGGATAAAIGSMTTATAAAASVGSTAPGQP